MPQGDLLQGEQPAILDRALFDAVQARLNEQVTNHKAKWMKSEALLTGRIFDDRGNGMTPSHARRGNVKYRYYLSSTLLQGIAERAGSVRRVPATDVESLVIKSVREHLKPSQPIDDRSLICTRVARVEVQPKQLVIHLTEEPKGTGNRKKTRAIGVIHVPWQKTPSTRRREILLPEGMPPQHARPIRSRATLVAAIARGRRWLDELTTDPSITTESIAKREDCSIRKVNMTISLAFLAPNLVIAAIDGRLPHGMGVARLTDLPAEWSRQHELLRLPSH
jgi:site-specific DNA recombinase